MGAIPSEESIAHHLFQAAETRTFERGVRFASKASSHMRDMAKRGANTILSTPRTKLDDESAGLSIRAASRVGAYSMIVFVDQMADQRLLAPGYIKSHGDELTEDLWSKVRDMLCPIWPIC